MTPQEKADELVEKFYQYANEEFEDKSNEYPGQVLSERRKIRKESSKHCALIAVDEILDVIKLMPYGMQYLSARDYFQEVKEEIQKL